MSALIRHRHAPTLARLLVALLMLSLWPPMALAGLACCDAAAAQGRATAQAATAGAAHAHHASPTRAAATIEDVAGADCHTHAGEPAAPHADCDPGCTKRCASPSFVHTPAWAGVAAAPRVPASRWTRSVPPPPQPARMLRPPISA